jgi:thioredoxin-like negative regulator of GroEL
MKPVIDKFIDENKDIEYIKIDVDSDYRTAQLYNIQSVPTLVSKIDGKVHDRVSGLVSEFVVKSLFG